jgi:hypothetical protein
VENFVERDLELRPGGANGPHLIGRLHDFDVLAKLPVQYLAVEEEQAPGE